MWLYKRDAMIQRDTAIKHLRLSQLQNRLASAAIDARRGEYEQARLQASDFFTDLRSEIDRRESAFSNAQLEGVKPILAGRDETITLLARGDETAVGKLSEIYVEYRQAMGSATLQQNQK